MTTAARRQVPRRGGAARRAGGPGLAARGIGVAGALGLVALGAGRVAAHGTGVPPAPDVVGLLFDWSFDLSLWLPLLATGGLYLLAAWRVNLAHPANPVPRNRPVAFLLGLAAIAIALQGGIERWDTTLFSIHMVQHLLLIFVAAPLLVLGAPITLVLRLATARVRQRYLVPALHSRVLRAVSHPLVAWLLFAAVMWGSHFSPLFDLALRDVLVHDLEHLLFLASAILFWWPVIGRDPAPRRMGYPARLMYLFSQMPLNSFLGVVILFAGRVLYPAYATTGRLWGPTPLDDQQLAGAIMWGLGDAAFLVAILLAIAAWMREEESSTRRREALEDGAKAAAVLRESAPGALPAPPAGSTGQPRPARAPSAALTAAALGDVAPGDGPIRLDAADQSGMGAVRQVR